MKVDKGFLLLVALSFSFHSYSQEKNLAEKLGYPKDAKLLILHADDVGLSHSEDSATITAYEKGGITSASIMVPCPWFPEIAVYAKQHAERDWGIHSTFTSEWKNYKWDGAAPSNEIPSLIDKNGYMYTSVEEFGKRTEVAVSSWHINKDENYAMWKIYAKGSYGIALQTTFERLKRCFDVTDKPIYAGKIIYYDESCDPIPFKENSFIPFLRKRLVYQYENEVRCCYVLSHGKDEEFSWQQQDVYNGVFIPVDLNTMIERIYISPYSPGWLREIVVGINEKFNFKKEIVHSKVFESVAY